MIFVAVVYLFLFIAMRNKGIQAVNSSMYYIIEMIEIIPVVFLLTSIIETWVPKEVIMNSFGDKSGIKGNILSFLLGSFSAGPIYAAFPVCKMLLGKGASIANIVIILSTWAVVKIPMLANEAKFLGVSFMGIRWILTTISIFVIAYLIALIVKKENIAADEAKTDIPHIKKEFCIGCGICSKMHPDCFSMVDGKASIKDGVLLKNQLSDLNEVAKKCPTKAIFINN